VLAVFLKDLLMLRRDRGALFISLIVPVLMITIIAEALHRNDDDIKMRVPVVNEDQGPVAGTFIKLLAEHADVVEMSRSEAEVMVRDENKAAAAIVFPEHLSKAYLQGRTADILLLTDPARSTDLEHVKVMLLLMDKRAAALADPLAEDRLSLRELSLTGNRYALTAFEQTVPGYALMFVLLAVIFGTAMGMHDERGWGTLPRLLVAPGGFTWMLVGKLLVRFVVGMAQLLVLLVFGHFVFGISLGPSPVALVLLAAAIIFPIVGLGMLAAGLAGTREQTLPIGLAFVLAFSCLGGLWWPPWVTPMWMQGISSTVFTTWAMQGMNDLMLRDRGLAALPLTTSVLVSNGIGLTALGLALFRARHSAR
jgi:ABC-type multidrug transport system permease subunit